MICLLRRLQPDFKTIADFRRDNREAFRQVFREFVRLRRELDLYGRELLAVDGTRIKAVNNVNRSFTRAKLERELKSAEERLERYFTFANPSASPILGTPNTYRYLVGTDTSLDAANADDALCLDVRFDTGAGICPGNDSFDPEQFVYVKLELRDDAFWDGNAGEYRCPDTSTLPPRSVASGVSNPVHEALGPAHVRRAAAVADAAVRDRARRWSPGSEQASFAVAPEVGLASLSGRRDGFDYTGISESATFGVETGAGAWQAGLVASFSRIELHYRAEATLAELGYRTGDHDTDILSLHPFAAWHAPSGGHIWASLGAGSGRLRHRDDLGFPSWSGSNVLLFTRAAGGSVPLAEVLSGELEAEAGIESFAFDIKGGDRISSSLATMNGLDYHVGLAWSAPVRGSLSVWEVYNSPRFPWPTGTRPGTDPRAVSWRQEAPCPWTAYSIPALR